MRKRRWGLSKHEDAVQRVVRRKKVKIGLLAIEMGKCLEKRRRECTEVGRRLQRTPLFGTILKRENQVVLVGATKNGASPGV